MTASNMRWPCAWPGRELRRKQVLRDNAKQMDGLARTRAERAAMSAVRDLI